MKTQTQTLPEAQTPESVISVSPEVQQILTESKLDWEVIKRPVIFTREEGGTPFQYLKKAVIMRGDNFMPLEVLGKSYEIMQNRQLVEIALEVAGQKNLKLTKGGYMQDGQLIYLQLEFTKNVKVAKDSVKHYMTFINSHDGSTSFKVGFGNTVMSCENQFDFFSKKSSLNFRHSSNMHETVASVLSKVDYISGEEKILTDNFKQFALVDATPSLIKDLMERLTGVDITLSVEQKAELYSTRKLDIVDTMLACINSEMGSKGNTLWGAFNGVTYYTNHVQTENDPGKRDYNLKFGSGYDINKKAYEYSVSLV